MIKSVVYYLAIVIWVEIQYISTQPKKSASWGPCGARDGGPRYDINFETDNFFLTESCISVYSTIFHSFLNTFLISFFKKRDKKYRHSKLPQMKNCQRFKITTDANRKNIFITYMLKINSLAYMITYPSIVIWIMLHSI